jgi:ERCC4-related helicase
MSSSAYPAPDSDKLRTWVYPTNYTVRSYQQEICEAALFQNTLVCLPTGLGKTLIAAVVMYNFHRWYPTGKVVFVAPTKPLVTQQIVACYEIVGIPEKETAHLEGSVPSERRMTLWREKCVFFCTPQTFANDLQSGICDARDIVCLVVDEAHKATSGFAYTTAVSYT